VALLRLTPFASSVPVVLASCGALAAVAPLGAATAEAKRSFDLPRGDAAHTLRQFAAAAGRSLVFVTDKVRGETTNAVRGEFTPREALERMLAGSALEAAQDAATGALVVSRRGRAPEPAPRANGEVGPVSDPQPKPKTTVTKSPRTLLAAVAGWLALGADADAQTAPANPATDTPIALGVFEVKSDKDRGYRKTNSVTTSRIGVSVLENPQAVQIISGELLADFNVTRADDVFRYSASVTSTANETGQANLFMLRGFNVPRYLNGMSQANSNSIYGEFTTDNLERVEIAKGAVGLFYGNSSPNGVVNYITKRPQFVNRGSLTLAGGSYGYQKALLDVQHVAGAARELGYRIVASATHREARVNHQQADTLFIAPSFAYVPTRWFRLDAEYNGTQFKKPYGTSSVWNSAINPQYYADIANPSPAILDYMRTRYGAANEAAARALVQSRWATPRFSAFLNNWSLDKLAITGTEPFWQTGSTIDWSRLSPEGDKWAGLHPESNQDGFSHLADVGATFTPRDGLAIRYRWVHQETKQNFVRLLYNPNGGLVNGRVPTFSASGLSLTLDGTRRGWSDTQQLDVTYEFDLGAVKNTVVAGAEHRRLKSHFGQSTANTAITGSATYLDYNPFTQPEPPLLGVATSVTPITARFLFKFEDYYASHRGKLLNGRLNTLLGYRKVKDAILGRGDDTFTYGAIFEVIKGAHIFASTSETFGLTSAMNVSGTGVVAADNARVLDPEKGNAWELGLKSDLKAGVFSGSVSLFEVERDGIVLADSDANLRDPRNNDASPTNDVRYQVNGGVHRSRGLDVDLFWTPNPRLQVVLSYVNLWEAKVVSDPSISRAARTRVFVSTFERRLVKSPEHSASLVGKYNFTDGDLKGLSLGAALRYSSDYQANANAAYDLVVPSETTLDLFATYGGFKVLGHPLDLQVNATNVTDRVNDITRGNGLEFAGSVRLRF
jgi:outer membrane receptor protein involved in Fe transport